MSLDKAIENGKEHRRKYYDSRKYDASCRHGGNCDYCRLGRKHNNNKRERSSREKLLDYKFGD